MVKFKLTLIAAIILFSYNSETIAQRKKEERARYRCRSTKEEKRS
jgi:hypothetical protein